MEGAGRYVTVDHKTWIVPDGYLPDRASSWCRSCNAQILWCKTRSDKRMPLNPDGISHFATCPQADQWRKRDADR